jgi:hypothetical protein
VIVLNIRTKKDIEKFLNNLQETFEFDQEGEKYFFYFEDKERGGKLTIMNYSEDKWTYHGVGEDYCDNEETLAEKKEIIDILWKNRKAVNEKLKNLVSVS